MANDLVALNPREQWVHYSSDPTQIVFYDTDYSKAKSPGFSDGYHKPIGLWITPYGVEDNWFEWSMAEEFRISELNYVHDVELAAGANLLRISSVEGLDAFSQEYAINTLAEVRKPRAYLMPSDGSSLGSPIHEPESWTACDWPRLAQKYDGILITPYQWERRLMYRGETRTDWYYSWDCASGCIWNARAIERITLRSTTSAGYTSEFVLDERITERKTLIHDMTNGAENAMASRDD